jgi:hypothetical protein
MTNTNLTASYVRPLLNLTAAGTNLLLAWPSWAGFMQVGMATNLNPPISWTSLTNIPAVSGDLRLLLIPRESGDSFYRLQTGN